MPKTNLLLFIILMAIVFLATPPAFGTTNSITIDGCLKKDKASKMLILSAADDNQYYLMGHTTELSKYIKGRLKVTGSIEYTEEASPDDRPIPLKVASWEVIIDPNKPRKPIIAETTNWNSFLNRPYGILIRFPKGVRPLAYTDRCGWDLSEPDGKMIFSATISSDVNKGDGSFSEGYFSVYVNRDIHNAKECALIPECEGKSLSRKINGLAYAWADLCEYDLGFGSDSLHTFQNGLCYAFSFQFHTHMSQLAFTDFSCFEPDFYSNDFIDFLLSGVTFIKPTLKEENFEESPFYYQTTCANFRKIANGLTKRFSGTIGSGIKVSLQLKFEDEILSGTEQYDRIGKTLWLSGVIDPEDHFSIEERYPKDHVTGIFTGSFSQNCRIMTGYFSKPDGSQLQPFTFREVGTLSSPN